MITFKQFIREESDIKFKTDNPGGSWLQRKQSEADEKYNPDGKMAFHKGITGSITGYFTKYPKLPTSYLSRLPGAMGEEKFRDSSDKLERLEKEVGDPSKFDTDEHPIMVGVNHRGEAYITEGNHRVAYAAKHGIPHVRTEVKYFNGGEEVHGPHHPDKILNMAGK